jgi:RNase P/RNase MRP subunit p29
MLSLATDKDRPCTDERLLKVSRKELADQLVLLQADYHGCVVLVTGSANRTHIGTHGIIVRETKRTFQLVTPDDRMLS